MQKIKLQKSKFTYLYILSLALLLLYPLRHIHLGVDLWDGGYNYANFYYNGLEYMDSMWYYATWGANAFGSLLTWLPGGDTMLGMNIYTSLLVGLLAVGAYVFCVQKLHIPAWMVFVGEILAMSLCWAPTSALYNYLTYGFLLAGSICLYHGLTTGRNSYLILAGVMLGLNVSNRFSNFVQMGLILAVWYYAFLCKKKFSKVMQETGFCILGYVGAVGCFLLFMAVKYGLGNYIEGVLRLFDMTEHATDYAPGSMLTGIFKAYSESTSTYWMKRLGLAGIISLVICLVLPKKYIRWKQILTVAVNCAVIGWMLKKGYCTTDYTTYNAVYYPAIMILLMAVGLALYQLFDKQVKKEEKLLALLIPLTIYLTSLGGNNAIYSSINNLFLVMPCFIWMAYKFLKEKKQIFYFPFQTVLTVSMVLLLLQGVCFGNVFVYEEATGGRDLGTEITEVPVLKGMHTGDAKAEQLVTLYRYLQENHPKDSECILYGNIPGIAYYMELAPALNIWSDLRSYSLGTMEADLQEIAAGIAAGEDKPLVILEAEYGEYFETGSTEMEFDHITTVQKFEAVREFMEKHQYSKAYSNEKYTVYR